MGACLARQQPATRSVAAVCSVPLYRLIDQYKVMWNKYFKIKYSTTNSHADRNEAHPYALLHYLAGQKTTFLYIAGINHYN